MEPNVITLTVYFPVSYIDEDSLRKVQDRLNWGETALIYWDKLKQPGRLVKKAKQYNQFILRKEDSLYDAYDEVRRIQSSDD